MGNKSSPSNENKALGYVLFVLGLLFFLHSIIQSIGAGDIIYTLVSGSFYLGVFSVITGIIFIRWNRKQK